MIRPAILDRLRGVQRAGRGWLAFCPAHDDQHKRSLSVGVGDDGRTLLNCHAQRCPPEKITAAVGMTLADLAPPTEHDNGPRTPRRREVAQYGYTDERGVLLYEVVRFEPKDFRCRRRDDRGGWLWNLDGVRVVPYRLHELAEAQRVYIVEGEKDCDALAALGLAATTNHGGSGKWRGEHTAALVAAAVSEAVVLPDHDPPGGAHAVAIARSLLEAGLRVKRLDLPGLPPKGDVSDWLAAGGTRDQLEALADAAPALSLADLDAASEPAPAEPVLERAGLDLALTWPDGVRLALSAIRDHRSGVTGDVSVTLQERRLHWGALTLSATGPRETLRKKLAEAAPEIPWSERLEDACYRLTAAVREGEPIVELTGAEDAPPVRELLPRLLYEGQVSMVFADGDTGKSLLALALAIAMRSGAALPFGLRPTVTVPVAFLDYETSSAVHDERLRLLSAGLGLVPPPRLYYKRLYRPLVDEAAALAPELARRHVGLVVVDSMIFALATGEGFHEPVTAFFNALRLLAPAAVLVLSHITGADARGNAPARPFAGVFAFNGPHGPIWEAKRDPDITDATAIALTCRKANNLARKPEPFGLRFVPGDQRITVEPFDLTSAAPQTVVGATLAYRIRLALATADLTTPQLAETLKVDDATLRTTLRRAKAQGAIADLGAQGKAILWGLPR